MSTATMIDQTQYCTFHLGDLFLGVEVTRVQEVIRHQVTTPVPLASPVIGGLMNLRGSIVTTIDLRRRLGLDDRSEDQEAMNVVARDLLKQVGISKNIPPTTPIGSLSGGERQAVAIARAMHFDSDLIILDEPTNNLGVAETQGVLSFVRSARDSGHSCIFIAHNIHHVFQVVDRIVVMRRGKVVADDIDPKKTNVAEVERIITGMSDKEIHDAVVEGTQRPG